MEVILLQRVAKLGQMGRGRDRQGRLRPQLSVAAEKGPARQRRQREELRGPQGPARGAQNLETKKRGRSAGRPSSTGSATSSSARPPTRARSTGRSRRVTRPRRRPRRGINLVDRRQVLMTKPIKELGLHAVQVPVLHPEVEVEIVLNVRPLRRGGRTSGLRQDHPGAGRRGRGRRGFRDRRTVRRHRRRPERTTRVASDRSDGRRPAKAEIRHLARLSGRIPRGAAYLFRGDHLTEDPDHAPHLAPDHETFPHPRRPRPAGRAGRRGALARWRAEPHQRGARLCRTDPRPGTDHRPRPRDVDRGRGACLALGRRRAAGPGRLTS